MNTVVDDLREPHREECGRCRRHWSTCACAEEPESSRRLAVERALRDGDDWTAAQLLGCAQ